MERIMMQGWVDGCGGWNLKYWVDTRLPSKKSG
jgi:hypothetical protein